MRLSYILKGIIVGVGKIIPGFSGSVVMISFGLYDKAILAITNFFKDVKKNGLFLLNLGIGIIIGIVLFSRVINYFISNYYVYTMMLFIGLIVGGVPLIWEKSYKNIKGLLLALISLMVILLINSIGGGDNYIIRNNYRDIITFFVAGMLEGFGTIVPGISSTALLMLMGIYNLYLNSLGNIFNINNLTFTCWFFIPFSLGFLITIIGLAVIINYLFFKYEECSYSSILGILLGSVIVLFGDVIFKISNIKDLIISFILLIIGYYIGNRV